MRNILLIGFLLGLLLASFLAALYVWFDLGEAEIGFHGYLALALGAGATALVGIGLMTLVFISSRCGYDERAHRDRNKP